MRRPIVAGNWKMNKVNPDAMALAEGIKTKLADCEGPEIVLCPPFTALSVVAKVLKDSNIKLGAQNMHWEKAGAFTGEVSGKMLAGAGCDFVILGHSERRMCFGETDDLVNRKVKTALAAELCPIVCVGETLEQREKGQTEKVVRTQVERSLAGLGCDLLKTVIAYEPVWAIGTGRTATQEQAQEVHAFIRKIVSGMAGGEVAGAIRIQYGGSVKPSNAKELFAQPDIDGGLIGGASLEEASFVEIVRAAL